MGKKKSVVEGADVPIVKLTPLRERKVGAKSFRKLKANLAAVGLIEPLCVCREGEMHYILDGYVRYRAFLEMGVETVPCLILQSRDLYTPNRQVNNLSRKQETKMLRQALETLDEKTVAEAFGMESLGTRLDTALYKDLHEDVRAALDAEKITRQVAKELKHVTQKRQQEILALMEKSGDWSLRFAKTQILQTPPGQRTRKKRRSNPWDASAKKKRNLVKKLTEVEDQYDFYSTIYRQYVADLLKLVIYVRQIVNRPALLEYLEAHRPETVRMFNEVLAESEGKAAG